ncbi:MAG TPA: glycosyltransferase [Candidatus Kapabacteria bacterium]|nr:glycosyltransferase [Candidatus Kapabacteria bacterium]
MERTSSSRRKLQRTHHGARKLISVIVPSLNEEKLLPGCLEQFTPEIRERFSIEVIVSDGGSQDNTVGIATAYADKLVVHEDIHRRQTISEGRNRGADAASGTILIFLNADTRIANPTTFFERISIRFSLDPTLAALAVKVQVFPSERKFIDTIFHSFFNRYVRFLNTIGIGAGRGECQIVRRAVFQAVKGYNEHYPAGEDFDLYNRISHFGNVAFDKRLLVFESPRRYRKYGYFRVYRDWVRNGVRTFFHREAASGVWEEVR